MKKILSFILIITILVTTTTTTTSFATDIPEKGVASYVEVETGDTISIEEVNVSSLDKE